MEGNCPPVVHYFEGNHYKFISNNPKFSLDFVVRKNDELNPETIYITNNNVEFILYLVDINNKEMENFIDSINVRNKWYKNVTEITKSFEPNLHKLYYNKDYGILKFQNADSTVIWELIK